MISMQEQNEIHPEQQQFDNGIIVLPFNDIEKCTNAATTTLQNSHSTFFNYPTDYLNNNINFSNENENIKNSLDNMTASQQSIFNSDYNNLNFYTEATSQPQQLLKSESEIENLNSQSITTTTLPQSYEKQNINLSSSKNAKDFIYNNNNNNNNKNSIVSVKSQPIINPINNNLILQELNYSEMNSTERMDTDDILKSKSVTTNNIDTECAFNRNLYSDNNNKLNSIPNLILYNNDISTKESSSIPIPQSITTSSIVNDSILSSYPITSPISSQNEVTPQIYQKISKTTQLQTSSNIKTKKPVGFINLQQNGWNLNFITTTNLASPTTKVNSPTLNKPKVDINKNSNKNIFNNQENAYFNRCIVEDVHNYSKKSKRFPNYCSTTNSSENEDETDDDDDDDDESDDDIRRFNIVKRNLNKLEKNSNKINKEKSTIPDMDIKEDILEENNLEEHNEEKLRVRPEHHARRPMNAFLIFCKRHRAIVRDKYRNVENRQVTKILGEWWENMTEDEKKCYADLAKEYKDAFLSANPNFKWYKLPAPPLRTLITRPITSTDSPIPEESSENPNTSENDHNEKSPKKHHIENVGVFRFADETQMGGISNLFTGTSPESNKSLSPILFNSIKTQKLEENDLQNALSETSEFISIAIPKDTNTIEPFENMRDHAKKMTQSAANGLKRKASDLVLPSNCNEKIIRDNSFSSSEDDNLLLNRKPARSCKGKKYQELISSGQITPSIKKVKKSNKQSLLKLLNGYTKDSSSDSDGIGVNLTPTKAQNSSIIDDSHVYPKSKDNTELTSSDNNMSNSPMKPFDTKAFDLEAKIMALPAQNLEEYIQKKQESKSKKKITTKRRKNFGNNNKKLNLNGTNVNATLNNINIKEAKEQIVGSQKRKARKESITRRDLNAIYGEIKQVNVTHIGDSAEIIEMIEIKQELPDDVNKNELNEKTHDSTEQNQTAVFAPLSTSDLLILAEVASNFDE